MLLLILMAITLLCTSVTSLLLAPLTWLASIHLPLWLILMVGVVLFSWLIGD